MKVVRRCLATASSRSAVNAACGMRGDGARRRAGLQGGDRGVGAPPGSPTVPRVLTHETIPPVAARASKAPYHCLVLHGLGDSLHGWKDAAGVFQLDELGW